VTNQTGQETQKQLVDELLTILDTIEPGVSNLLLTTPKAD
jgi:hypothetical protein